MRNMLVKLSLLVLATMICFTTALAQDGTNSFAGQVPVNVSLKQALSSRNAKPGQPIAATFESPATINGTMLPRGSMLLGHVVDVTKHGGDTPNGSLTIVFDQVKPKKGDPMPIRSSIYRIMPSEGMLQAQRTDADMGMRGTAAESSATSAIRQNTDRNDRTVSGMQSSSGSSVQVVSAVPGVALSAVASDSKSGIMSSRNQDVDLGAGLNMVIGVAVK